MTSINPTCCVGLEEKISALVDQELSMEIADKVKSHLTGCLACYETYQVEILVKQRIAKSCKGDKAPQELVLKIKQEIFTIYKLEEED